MNTAVEEKKLNVGEGIDLFILSNPVNHPKAAVVLVHGICEHCRRYDYVTDKLNSFGYTVYRFDLRGHGRTGGERGYIKDYQDMIEDTEKVVTIAKKENPNIPIYMWGHSMGGFIAASYGIKYPNRLSGQILSGPPVKIMPPFDSLLDFDYKSKAFDLIPNSLVDKVSRDPEIVRLYKEDPLCLTEFTYQLMGEMFIRGGKDIMESVPTYNYPCLILHGSEDQIVNKETSNYFFGNIASKDKQLKIYDGLYHEVMNEPEKDTVLEDIHQWLQARI
jgi:acylglycerol lipase